MTQTQRANTDSIASLLAAITLLVGSSIYMVILTVLMGNFADSLSLNEAQLGGLVATYMTGFTISTISGYWWVTKWNWRRVIVGASFLGTAMFFAPIVLATYPFLMICHVLTGVASGAVYSVALTLLCDREQPERALALAYGAQAFSGFTITQMMPTGPDSYVQTLLILACSMGVCLLVLPLLPKGSAGEKSNAAATSPKVKVPKWVVYAGLAVVMIPYMAEVSIVTFTSEIARDKSLSREFAQQAASYAQLTSFAGSMLAAFIGMRFGRLAPIVFGTSISLAAISLLIGGTDSVSFMAATLLTMAAFGFSVPYRLALVADADEEGRYAPWAVSAQTIAGIAGPGISGVLIAGGSYPTVYAIWTGLVVAGLAIYMYATVSMGAKSVDDLKSRPSTVTL